MRIRHAVVAVVGGVVASMLVRPTTLVAAAPSDATGVATTEVATSPVVGVVAGTSPGYWLVAGDGTVTAYGGAVVRGSTGSMRLNRPVVGMAATPSGLGYWLVASDGGVFAFGDAVFRGSTGSMTLNRPVVGMAATPSGLGYWLVASDGGVFAFGDAVFRGSTGSIRLNRPVVGMAVTGSGRGYWMVAADGGIFSFGDASFHGATAAFPLDQPVVGMARTADGLGYWLATGDGGLFTFGTAQYFGSPGPRLGSRQRVLLIGDSLAVEASKFFAGAFVTVLAAEDPDVDVFSSTRGGVALCDDLALLATQVEVLQPQWVVLEFSGNYFTPCMTSRGADTASEIAAAYGSDAQAAMRSVAGSGATVIWAGPPPERDATLNGIAESVDAVYARLPAEWPNATYDDAGRAVSWEGRYTDFLPCLDDEPCLITTPSGRFNPVRSWDGVHFCPGSTYADGGCSIWSSGAWRYARAMADPVIAALTGT